MKKIVIILLGIILVAAALPIIGNSIMNTTIQTRVSELQSYGLKDTNSTSQSSYLRTKKHFEFVLEDADAFVEYLSQYSNEQIPPYVTAMLEGAVVGVDLEYMNLPFSKAVEMEVYPMRMSENLAETLQEEDVKFYKYVKEFLHSKGVLYHINYNIVSEDFDGYIKDINESQHLKEGALLTMQLYSANFEGNGKLIAPSRLLASVKKLNLELLNDDLNEKEKLTFSLKDMKTSTNYESKTTYISTLELQELRIALEGTENDISSEMKGIAISASSNTQDSFAEVNSKSSIKSLHFTSKDLNFMLKEGHFDIALNSLDKESFMKVEDIISKRDLSGSPYLETALEKSLLQLLSKGLVMDIADFSLENLTLDGQDDLKGFSLKSHMRVKEDNAFSQKMQISPMLLIPNLEMSTKIKLSKEIYAKLRQGRPMSAVVASYILEDKDNILLNIDFLNGKLKLNGKEVQ